MADQIPKKPFGKGTKQVSVIGMGCSPFGHAYGVGNRLLLSILTVVVAAACLACHLIRRMTDDFRPCASHTLQLRGSKDKTYSPRPLPYYTDLQTPDEKAAYAAVQSAFKQGVNFFDVAPFYAAGKAEELLGRCIKDLPREEIFVATKVGKYVPGEDEDFSAERVTKSVHESLQRLQLEYIDLIHCHDIESAKDMKQIVVETIPALQKLKSQGLVRAIGITGLPLDIYSYVLDRVPEGSVDAVLSYCHNNLSDNTLQSMLPYLEKKNVAVISASFSSMGLLTQKEPPSWHPASPEVKKAADECREICASKGVDLARLAIKFFIRTPGIQVHLMGMANPHEVDTDLQVVREALGLIQSQQESIEQQTLQQVQAILRPVMDQTWHTGRHNNRT